MMYNNQMSMFLRTKMLHIIVNDALKPCTLSNWFYALQLDKR